MVSVDGVTNPGGNVDLVPGSNITIAGNDTANTVTIGAIEVWKLIGNAGTGPSSNFLGTTDDQPLELRVNNSRTFRLEPSSESPNIIGGFSVNNVAPGVYGATISGGGAIDEENFVTDNYGTIGGGYGNGTYGDSATVGRGYNNNAIGDYATIGGGHFNHASEEYGTVGGGYHNYASGGASTVGGGYQNLAYGDSSTVPGGLYNMAYAHYSFAAGRKAKATHDGSFVWSGSNRSEEDYFESVTDKEFAVRCAGGARFVTQYSGMTPTKWAYLNPSTAQWEVMPASDRNLKDSFAWVDVVDILNRLASMPVQTWTYKGDDKSIRHIGPTSQDFYTAFSMGRDDKSINSIDTDGVALAAIQGLYEIVKEKDAKIIDQHQQIAQLEERVAVLEALILSQNRE